MCGKRLNFSWSLAITTASYERACGQVNRQNRWSTWKQLEPAVIDALPGGPPVNYWVMRRNAVPKFTQKYWDGTAWQTI